MEWFELFLNDPVWYCIKIFSGLCGVGVLICVTMIINSYLNEKQN